MIRLHLNNFQFILALFSLFCFSRFWRLGNDRMRYQMVLSFWFNIISTKKYRCRVVSITWIDILKSRLNYKYLLLVDSLIAYSFCDSKHPVCMHNCIAFKSCLLKILRKCRIELKDYGLEECYKKHRNWQWVINKKGILLKHQIKMWFTFHVLLNNQFDL